MEKIKKQMRSLIVLIAIFALPFASYAKDLNAAQLVIKETSDQLYKILQTDREVLASDRQRVLQLVDEVIEPRVDLNKVSKLVLGKYWRKASPEQRTAFQREFKALLVNTYATAFTEFGEWQIHFIPMNIKEGAKRVMVKTEIIQPSRPPIAVNYRMAVNKENKWKAYDIIIEGISMVTNYKSGFANSIKRNGGLDKVIEDLAAKNKTSISKAETANIIVKADAT